VLGISLMKQAERHEAMIKENLGETKSKQDS